MDIKNEMLCRLWKSKRNPNKNEPQIVLPAQYQFDILKMTHDMPMAGHMGVE